MKSGGLLRKNSILLLFTAFFIFNFSPQLTPKVFADTDSCFSYQRQIKDALANCDFHKLLKIERALSKETDCAQAQELVKEAKCQYFFDCAMPALNQAYVECDLETILKIEETILPNLRDCLEYPNIKENILNMKCLYYDSCVKKELNEAQKSCNWTKIQEIESLLRSNVLKDCPDYRRKLADFNEYKCRTLDLCNAADLNKAAQNCDLGKILEMDDSLRKEMKNCQNFPFVYGKVRQAKCDAGQRCAKKIKENFTVSDCQPDKLLKIDTLIPLNRFDNCSPYQYNVIKKLANDMKCDYLGNCADFEFKHQQAQCELEDLFYLEKVLEDCSIHEQIRETIKKNKPQIVKRCFQKRLNEAVRNCDIQAIQQWEKFLAENQVQNDPNLEELKQMVVTSKKAYFECCLESKLKSGVDDCNLDQIRQIAQEINTTLADHPDKVELLWKVGDSECIYFVNCTQRELNEAVENCDYNQLKKLKSLSKQEDIKHCPGYDLVEPGISDALQLYYYSCAEKQLYNAYNNCDWNIILQVEKMVEDELKFYQGYRKIRVTVLEVKCSYFMTCLKEQLDNAVKEKDAVKIAEFEQLINQEMGPCPNYPTLTRIIQEAKEKIR